MKLTKFDIGAEIISILTRGMYPDPKDALREYIQNGVDAKANQMKVKIRQESIVIEDDGVGMNRDVLRKAVRIGVSDKNPTKNVGFMGIGIYSSFHLSNSLSIFSKGDEKYVNRLDIDFGKMKNILKTQRDLRLRNQIKSEELVDLQSLLESCITLTDDGELSESEFPAYTGTRVELSGIDLEFYSALSDFNEVADYLQDVIPLKFNESEFAHARQIEKEVSRICEENGQTFEIVDLILQVNTQVEKLYRPYQNIDFNKEKIPLEPVFQPIQSKGIFYGVAWGCLNSIRRKLDNKRLRGFILKKQGFSIGKRENLLKFFPRKNMFFDRYSGEVIIVNSAILPNASRNDVEYTPLRTQFYNALKEVAVKFDAVADEFQEKDKAKEELAKLHSEIQTHLGNYNEFEENAENLIELIVSIKKIIDELKKRTRNKRLDPVTLHRAKALLEQANDFEKSVQNRISALTAKRKNKKSPGGQKSKVEIAKGVSAITVDADIDERNYENLFEVFVDLELPVDDRLKDILDDIDEMFIQASASTKSEYYKLLQDLYERFQNG